MAAGVRPEKVVAYDVPPNSRPSDNPVKSLPAGAARHVVFAGVVKTGKGIGDLVDAVLRHNGSGHPTRLTVCGDGPDLPELRRRAVRSASGPAVEFLGRVANTRVRELLKEASIACVP